MTNHIDLLAQFKVSTLTPRDNYGRVPEGNASYELTKFSAAPFRISGRDKLGMDIEETINIAYSQRWVHPSGTVNNVPMRTAPVFTMSVDAVAYENEMTIVMLRNGWLPLWVCPFSMEYRSITGQRCLIANPDKIDDCGGHPDGCEHLQPVIALRAATTIKNYNDKLEAFTKMTKADANLLINRMTQALELARATATQDDEHEVLPRPTAGKKGA